ncbi:MAG: C-GCAxxG-C-C family protein [Oscillospiraceae bacterium]|nr:C-GCAxxG-C-C family protein [Oscillospiraceae bacterium]
MNQDNQSKVENAVECFQNGFNCAQAILSTYCEDFGLDKETALKIACGLGAGMGRLGETCGAVSAAYLLIGLKYGTYLKENELEHADIFFKEKTYATVKEFAKLFEEKNKTTICRELLGVDFDSGDKQTVNERVKTICPKMIRDSAEIVEKILV